MRLSYNFTKDEKKRLINVADNEEIEAMLELPGKSVLFQEEAFELADRIQAADWRLAHRIRTHPGIVDK